MEGTEVYDKLLLQLLILTVRTKKTKDKDLSGFYYSLTGDGKAESVTFNKHLPFGPSNCIISTFLFFKTERDDNCL